MSDAVLAVDLAFALTASVATFFAPCAYPLLPGYVGFYASQTDGDGASLGGSFARGLTAGIGVLATFALVAGLLFAVGYERFSAIELVEPLVGVFLLVFGLLVIFDRAPSLSIPLPKRRSSVLGFGVFGAGYALAAVGCVVPLFVGVIGRALSLPPGAAALLLGTYVGGVFVLMIALTVATGLGLTAGTTRIGGYGDTLKQLAGVVMVAAGLGQLYLAVFVLEVI